MKLKTKRIGRKCILTWRIYDPISGLLIITWKNKYGYRILKLIDPMVREELFTKLK